VERGIIWVADEVEHALAHDLAAHGHKQRKVEHVTCANEPMHETRRPRTLTSELPASVEGGVLEERQHCKIKEQAAVQREGQHFDADDQDHLEHASCLLQDFLENTLDLPPLLRRAKRVFALEVESPRHGKEAVAGKDSNRAISSCPALYQGVIDSRTVAEIQVESNLV
jgi:hypothetical protein